MRRLSVFVSSTCYDLKHVREELAGCIRKLGHEPILSEQGSFPVDPTATTIENCIDAVNAEADILVLVVGKRYGSTVPAGKSITNLEYEAARIKGIPIYVFIDQEVTTLLPIYEQNPGVALQDVDDPEGLFAFVRTLRSRHQMWCFPFTTVASICETLSAQFSILFSSSLVLRRRLRDPETDWMRRLSPRLAFLVTSQGQAWESRFLLEALKESLESRRSKRWLLKHDVAFAAITAAGDDAGSIAKWISSKLNEVQLMVGVLDRLFSRAIQDAMKEPGVPADPYELFLSAESIGSAYEALLDIAGSIVLTQLPEDLVDARDFLKGAIESLLDDLESYVPESLRSIDEALIRIAAGERGIVLHLTCTFSNYFGERESEHEAILEKLRRML